MKPVNQKICNFVNGDCFSSCVASIFEIDVPNFMSGGQEKFSDNVDRWCEKMGLTSIDLSAEAGPRLYGCYTIASGPSPRNPDYLHAVVYYQGVLFHDPHPDKTGIIGKPIIYTIFVQKNPAIRKVERPKGTKWISQ